ncbi:MAG: hypothetical protein JRJ65_13005 [Deltaproteobacteria bacterium]|nr:hypothetical protein [Deltaproteobacteria bacterium]
MKIERFEGIETWQLARGLTRKVYALTKKDRFACDFGLKGQIQDVYDHAGRTRATIPFVVLFPPGAGLAYDQGQRKKGNPEQ